MTSKTLFLTLAIFLALTSAQDCDNPLLDVFGIQGLPAPESGAALTACPNLQSGNTCCTEATIQSLQANLTETSDDLNTIAGDRDLYIAQLFFNITTNYTTLISELETFNNDITTIQATNPLIGNALRQQYNLFLGIANSLVTDEPTFTQNFVAYQQARTTCWTTLLQIQSAAWCLACDPNYASFGVQPDGSINSGDAICNSVQAACAPYLFDGLQFNALIQAQQTLARVSDTVAFLNAYRANGNQLPPGQSIDTPPTQTPQQTVIAPPGCTATACPWQCTNLFSDSFALNSNVAANGAGILGGADVVVIAIIGPVPVIEEPSEGELAEFAEEALAAAEEALAAAEEALTAVEELVAEAVEAVTEAANTVTEAADNLVEEVVEAVEEVAEAAAAATGTRLLYEDERWNWRFLQAGTWNPAVNSTGFNVTVEDDPANVSNADEGAGQPEINPTPAPQGATVVKVTGSLLVILAAFMI